MESARKRRKWDVAAPGGMPLTGNRAGIGSGASSNAGLSGFITAQGFQVAHAAAAPPPTPVAAAASLPQPGTDLKPGQPVDQATIARAQQGAQAIVERINAVRQQHLAACEQCCSANSNRKLLSHNRSFELRARCHPCEARHASMMTARTLLGKFQSMMHRHQFARSKADPARWQHVT